MHNANYFTANLVNFRSTINKQRLSNNINFYLKIIIKITFFHLIIVNNFFMMIFYNIEV